jgi:microcystin degradation protein MlrC
VTVGAEVDAVHEGPVELTGTVHSIHHGDRDAVTEVVIAVGGLHVIVTELRKPYHHEHDFTDLGLAPRDADIVFVKIGYLEPELYDMAADWMMALTPGGVDQDLLRLGHHRIRRPMLPFDAPDFAPDLSARLIPASNAPLTGDDE